MEAEYKISLIIARTLFSIAMLILIFNLYERTLDHDLEVRRLRVSAVESVDQVAKPYFTQSYVDTASVSVTFCEVEDGMVRFVYQ